MQPQGKAFSFFFKKRRKKKKIKAGKSKHPNCEEKLLLCSVLCVQATTGAALYSGKRGAEACRGH